MQVSLWELAELLRVDAVQEPEVVVALSDDAMCDFSVAPKFIEKVTRDARSLSAILESINVSKWLKLCSPSDTLHYTRTPPIPVCFVCERCGGIRLSMILHLLRWNVPVLPRHPFRGALRCGSCSGWSWSC